MGIEIRTANASDLEALSCMAATQQARPESHIAFLGMSADSIALDIAELDNWHNTAAVAIADGAIVGALIPEVDVVMGRVWWFGPFIDTHITTFGGTWDTTADRLYSHARGLLPAHISEEEAFIDSRSSRLDRWCARHELIANEGSVLLTLRDRPDVASNGVSVRPVDVTDHEVVSALHDATFPGTHTTARALLSASKPRAVIERNGTVVGYVAYEVQPDNSGYIDYLAVDPNQRGTGLGSPPRTAKGSRSSGDVRGDDDTPTVSTGATVGDRQTRPIIDPRPLWGVTVGSCATGAREPGQGRKAAALSDACRVPQIAWPSLPKAGGCIFRTAQSRQAAGHDLGGRLYFPDRTIPPLSITTLRFTECTVRTRRSTKAATSSAAAPPTSRSARGSPRLSASSFLRGSSS